MSDQRERKTEEAVNAAWSQFHKMPSSNPGDYARAILRALERFEEANTPTDDEDRALAWAEYRKDYEPNPAHFGREHVAFFAGWDAREGFHRTVQGEPPEVAVSAAGEVLYGISWGTDLADPDLVRAALRAAAATEGGERDAG